MANPIRCEIAGSRKINVTANTSKITRGIASFMFELMAFIFIPF